MGGAWDDAPFRVGPLLREPRIGVAARETFVAVLATGVPMATVPPGSPAVREVRPREAVKATGALEGDRNGGVAA